MTSLAALRRQSNLQDIRTAATELARLSEVCAELASRPGVSEYIADTLAAASWNLIQAHGAILSEIPAK